MSRSIETDYIMVTLQSSFAGMKETHRKTLRSLGLRKMNSVSVLPNVNTILGQVNKVIQFIKVEAYSEPQEDSRGQNKE